MSAPSRLLPGSLPVVDMDRSLAFYQALGLRVKVDRTASSSGGRTLALGYSGTQDEALIEITTTGERPAGKSRHLSLAVADLKGLCDRLAALDVSVNRALPSTSPEPPGAFISDPDGHRIELSQPAGSGAIRHSIAHDGLDFALVEMGQGAPMMLLHGGASRADHFTDLMAQLQDGYRCIAYDQRGFAGTGATADSVIDHAHWAGDIPVMLDQVGIARTVLLGWSMGASIAINAARQWPDRVAAIVLLGAPDPRQSVDVAKLRRRLREGEEMSSDDRRTRDVIQLRSVLGKDAGANPSLLRRLLDERGATPPALAARAIEAYATRPNLLHLIPTLNCPVHLIAGEKDPVCPPDAAAMIRSILPHATIDIIPSCGHYYALEQPGFVASVIKQRLGGS